jgi:hypothetical protein
MESLGVIVESCCGAPIGETRLASQQVHYWTWAALLGGLLLVLEFFDDSQHEALFKVDEKTDVMDPCISTQGQRNLFFLIVAYAGTICKLKFFVGVTMLPCFC